MPESLPSAEHPKGARPLKSLIWSATERLGSVGISFVVSIVMSRLIAPREFGMVAMLQIFIAISQVIAESGIGRALMRQEKLRAQDKSTALLINIVLGCGMYLLLWFAAPAVAEFYDVDNLMVLMRLMALTVPLSALCVVQNAELCSSMRFGILCRISALSALISGCLGIWLAYEGMGAAALAWQQISFWSLQVLMLWIAAPIAFSAGFCNKSAKKLLGFSWKLTAASLLDAVWKNIYALCIGKFFASRMAGLFWRADTFANLPAAVATDAINRVAYPLFGRNSSSKERLGEIFSLFLGVMAWVIVPIAAIMMVLAEPLIIALLGKAWLPAVPMFRCLCVSAMFYPVHAINLSLLTACGRSGLFLKLELIKKLMVLLMLSVALPSGVMAVCWGIVLVSISCVPLNMIYTHRLAGYSFLRQIKILLPIFFSAFLSALVAWSISMLGRHSDWIALFSGTLAGVAAYLFFSFAMQLPWFSRLRRLKI